MAAHAIEEFDVKWTANSMYAASMDTVKNFTPICLDEVPDYFDADNNFHSTSPSGNA